MEYAEKQAVLVVFKNKALSCVGHYTCNAEKTIWVS